MTYLSLSLEQMYEMWPPAEVRCCLLQPAAPSMPALACGVIYLQGQRILTLCVTSGMTALTSTCRMNEVLLDSDILIDHLRGYDPARAYLKRFEAGEETGYLSVITVFDANITRAWRTPLSLRRL